MDYKKHIERDEIEIPEWLNKYLHLTRYIGFGLAVVGLLIGFLIVGKIIVPTLTLLLFAVFCVYISGPTWLYGMMWSNSIDREDITTDDYVKNKIAKISNHEQFEE